MPSRKKSSTSSQSGSESSQDSSWCDLLGSMQSLSIHKATTSISPPPPAGSDSSSQILHDFFSDSASVSSHNSTLSVKEQKLALWQAILVTVGLCEGENGAAAMANIKRPKHFPDGLLPLPQSLTACRKLIRKYVFINIKNLKASQRKKKAETLILFSSPSAMRSYTILHGHFYRLSKAKEEFLSPLLLDMFRERRLQVIYEDEEDSDEDYY